MAPVTGTGFSVRDKSLGGLGSNLVWLVVDTTILRRLGSLITYQNLLLCGLYFFKEGP